MLLENHLVKPLGANIINFKKVLRNMKKKASFILKIAPCRCRAFQSWYTYGNISRRCFLKADDLASETPDSVGKKSINSSPKQTTSAFLSGVCPSSAAGSLLNFLKKRLLDFNKRWHTNPVFPGHHNRVFRKKFEIVIGNSKTGQLWYWNLNVIKVSEDLNLERP